MTRINADMCPRKLADQHLIAEYRELPMVMSALRRSLRTRSSRDIIDGIPKEFTLNSGHVTFFFDKMNFLKERYHKLVNELKDRGFHLDPERKLDFGSIPPEFFNGWVTTEDAQKIVEERIASKIAAKPRWYKLRGKPINQIYT